MATTPTSVATLAMSNNVAAITARRGHHSAAWWTSSMPRRCLLELKKGELTRMHVRQCANPIRRMLRLCSSNSQPLFGSRLVSKIPKHV